MSAHGQQVAAPWRQGDEQPLVGQLVAAPLEYAVIEQVGESPAAAPQVGPAEPDSPVGGFSGEVDHHQVPVGGGPRPGEQVAAGLVVGPAPGLEQLPGPRPHAVQGKLQNQLFDEAVDGYFARHRVKPGITGWAQINGWRGEIDNEEKIQKRVEFDLYYIENWSVLFDLYILLRTPLALMTKNENAY